MAKFYGRRRNYRKKSAPKKRTYKRRGATRVSASVKRYVNKTIHKNIENKTEQTLSLNNAISTYAYNTSLFVVSCIPYSVINLGYGSGDRIGNTIRTRKVMFNFVLRPEPYSNGIPANGVPNPQEVLIFFGKVKNAKPQAPISTDFAKLWQAGDSSHAPYSTTLDLIQDVNKDWFQVFKVLRYKVGYSIATGTGNNASSQYYANNDFKLNVCKRLNITKYCPKVIKFNDATSQPTNDGLWMWAMAVNADGTTNLNQVSVKMDYTLNFEYEDA